MWFFAAYSTIWHSEPMLLAGGCLRVAELKGAIELRKASSEADALNILPNLVCIVRDGCV